MAYYVLRNERKRFVAAFSPKCGCTTLKNWFLDSLDPELRVPMDQLGRFVASGRLGPGDERILFLRDPFRRLVSFYCHFVVRDPSRWCFAEHGRGVPLDGRSFEGFVRLLHWLWRGGRRFQHHLEPQVDGIEFEDFDEVVPIEELDARMGPLCERLGVGWEPARRNATPYDESQVEWVGALGAEPLRDRPPPAYPFFYSDETVALASEFYARDLEVYRREFGRCPIEMLRKELAAARARSG